MSFAPFPQRRNFFYQKTFCDIASQILQKTCDPPMSPNRKFFLDKKQPNLCFILEEFSLYFGSTSNCSDWPENFFEKYKLPNETLAKELFNYGEDNLAMVHVMIQSPYITKIKKDVAMSFLNYIANAGGLLSLGLGFSFISGIEIIFWLCCFCYKTRKNGTMVSPKIYGKNVKA